MFFWYWKKEFVGGFVSISLDKKLKEMVAGEETSGHEKHNKKMNKSLLQESMAFSLSSLACCRQPYALA